MSNKKSVAVVENKDLCCSCGLCASYCKKNAISYRVNKLGFYVPVVDPNKCVDCSVCLNACPGANDLKNYSSQEEQYCYGYSLDEEMHLNASSGGVTTELLCYLINHKVVDYVTCVTNRQMDNAPRQILTNDIDVIRGCRTSKYCPVRWEDTVSHIEKVDGSVAVVALPCQVNSLKKYYANKKHNIKYFISLLCNHTPSLYAANYLIAPFENSKLLSIINRSEGFPGYMRLQFLDAGNAEHIIKYPFRKAWAAGYGKYFKSMRCMVCNDPFSKNADIVMGDSYFLQDTDTKGTTFSIVRNPDLFNILLEMKNDGIIHLEEGPSDIAMKKAFRVLYDRELTFQYKNAILSKIGKGIFVLNNTPPPTSYHQLHVSLRNIVGFRKRAFTDSIGKFHFLWKALVIKNKLSKLVIKA